MSLAYSSQIPPNPYVRVFVWRKSEGFFSSASKKDFGHVAVETRTGGQNDQSVRYISFWPGKKETDNRVTICSCNRDVSHFHNYAEDCNEEERPADRTYILLKLDIEKIHRAFHKFYNEGHFHWKVTGSSFLRYTYERNCAGLTLYLLKKGGIGDMVPRELTEEHARVMFATALSAGAVAGVSFWLLSCLSSFIFSWRTLSAFWQDYLTIVSCYKKAAVHFENLRALSDQFPINDEIEKIKGYLELPRDWALGETQFERALGYADQRIKLATASLLIPTVCSISVIFLNNRLLLKTITPGDVENIVKKTSKAPSSIKYSQSRERLVWLTTGLGAALTTFFLFKSWKLNT